MQKLDCFEFGHIAQTHGLKGDVLIAVDVDNIEEYRGLDAVFLEMHGQLVPYFLTKAKPHQKNKLLVHFEGIDHIEKAQPLQSTKLFLPLDMLPELENDQFYLHEIENFIVFDQKLGELGPVTAIYDMPTQTLIGITYQDREILFPMNDDIMLSVDKEKESIQVNLPDGLIDVYLED